MAATTTTTSATQLHIVTGIGGAIGAAVGFSLGLFGLLPSVLPSMLVEAAGAGVGSALAHAIDTLTMDTAVDILKDFKVVGGTAAIYYGLGLLPMQTIGLGGAFLTGAAVPLKGFAAGVLSSWYLQPTKPATGTGTGGGTSR